MRTAGSIQSKAVAETTASNASGGSGQSSNEERDARAHAEYVLLVLDQSGVLRIGAPQHDEVAYPVQLDVRSSQARVAPGTGQGGLAGAGRPSDQEEDGLDLNSVRHDCSFPSTLLRRRSSGRISWHASSGGVPE